jgi:hypothetical protein
MPETMEEVDRTVAALYGVAQHEHERLSSFLLMRLGMAGNA